MFLNLDNYKIVPSTEGDVSTNHEVNSIWQKGGTVGFMRSFLGSMLRWYFVKFTVAGIVLCLTIFGLYGFEKMSEDQRDMFSTYLASDAYVQAVTYYFSKTKAISTIANAHPVYKSDGIDYIEKAENVRIKKLFWVVKNQVEDEEKSRFYLLMRNPAKNKDGSLYTVTTSSLMAKVNPYSEDADEYCARFGGEVPTEKMVVDSAKSINFIRRPKMLEVFSDSKKGTGAFRCYIDPMNFQITGEQ